MSDTEERKSQELKIYELATASLVLGILILLMLIFVAYPLTDAKAPISIGLVAFAIVGIVLGIVALLKIKKSKGQLAGYTSAVLGVLINSFLVFGIVYGARSEYIQRIQGSRLSCAMNLHRIGMAMILYASDNDNKYPIVNKWSDLLLQPERYVERPEVFVCKSAGEGRCHYAMNPSCEPNSPADVVLLFETKGGWNQSGGPEILTTENHGRKGCNVLFNDGHVEFIKTERLNKLKWKVEEDKTKKADSVSSTE